MVSVSFSWGFPVCPALWTETLQPKSQMLLAGVKRSGACGPGLGQAPKRAKMFRERLNPVNMYGGGPFYTKGTSAANSVSDLFRSRFYNRGEIGSLQSGAADEAAVHVRLGYQLVGVLGVHGAPY